MAKPDQGPSIVHPYSLQTELSRGEELFNANNFREALIFYYEALNLAEDKTLQGKLHFRIGECLEAIRRFEFAELHYKLAFKAQLPKTLASRVLLKLKRLPALAQHEEALRLFKKAINSYRSRNIRSAIDDYLASLRLEPNLMAKDESGLIDDAIQYLTFLSESKSKEPQRLLKLATLLELKGEIEKAIEIFKQILIIYPASPEATEAEEKVKFFSEKRNSYLEIKRPHDPLKEVFQEESNLIVDTNIEFSEAGIISKELTDCAYSFKAGNEQDNIPPHRFETFSITLGKGANQKEWFFSAEDGVTERKITFTDSNCNYLVTISEISILMAYIQDIFGEKPRPAPLFSKIQLHLTISRK